MQHGNGPAVRVETGPWRRVSAYLGLERNIAVASGAVFLLGLGEELWKKFFPKYMEALGAGPTAIGLFGTAEDGLDALYQYPGGWLADRYGRRRALLLFVLLAALGYVIYGLSPSWPLLFCGLVFAMVWRSMASPAIFAVIGDSLPRERRAMGFTVQAILKRVPMIVSPMIGGVLMATYGLRAGTRIGLAVTLVFVGVTLPMMMAMRQPAIASEHTNIRGIWSAFDPVLKRLLMSDIIIRTCEGLAGIFIILYLTNVAGLRIDKYGLLVAVQVTTSILVYIPAARLADRIGRKPFVIATFLCFALFPLAVVLSSSLVSWVFAFIIGGLREIGEPSRKAMIVDFAQPHLRARTVGLYYLIRSLSVTPAAAVGGMLWAAAPSLPFYAAAMIGLLGTLVFALTVEERYAG